MTDQPAPLIPPEVDLRDFPFMPVEVHRILTSETWILGTGDERAAAITLWLASWHEVPAGSLPSADRMLAHLSQSTRWPKVKAHALRGWVLCSDGRRYHPVVCEKALEAWIEKLLNSLSGANGNAKRWGLTIDLGETRGQFIRAVAMLRALAPQSKTLKKKAVLTIAAGSPPDSRGDSGGESGGDSAGDRKGQRQRQGLTTTGVARADDPPPEPPAPPPPPDSPRVPPPPPPPAPAPFVPTPYGALAGKIKAGGIIPNSSHPDFRALVDSGAAWEEFEPHVARSLKADQPFPYLVAAVIGQRERAAKRGPLPPAPGPRAPAESPIAREKRERFAQFSPSIAAKSPAAPMGDVIDMEASDAPLRLG